MMLTKDQLQQLRAAPAARRIALAIELAGLTQAQVAQAIELPQPYISDVARSRYQTITVHNAHKFARLFGCLIEDLFPRKAA